MDALTDILKTVHLHGSVYCRSELTAPWGMTLPASDWAQFHVVRRGRCWLLIEGEDADGAPQSPLLLEAGDLVVLPKGTAHALVDDPQTRPEPLMDLLARHMSEDSKGPLTFGGSGDAVTLVCGYFQFQAGAVHPLLSILPPLITLRGEGGRARSWLESTAARPGGETLVDRLTEAMFIQVLRAHLEQHRDAGPSWLTGLRDEQIAAALGLIHRHPGDRWTVEQLATRVGMSRTAFSTRFRGLVGEPPLSYLTRWRMQVAANHLRDTRLTMPEIAHCVGYQGEAAFAKVFKRLLGLAPGQFRRQAASPSLSVVT